ncbi:hypothetical protein Dimus_004309 [Dionaea muscipula]
MEEDLDKHALSLSSTSKTRALKTELRLGLPGSESPERNLGLGVSHFGFQTGSPKVSSSGTKRVFSNAIIDGCGNWVRSINGGSSSPSLKALVSSAKEEEEEEKPEVSAAGENGASCPASKARVAGWPPICSFRRNTVASACTNNDGIDDEEEEEEESKSKSKSKSKSGCCLYVKVSMDGAPYLRKVDLNTHRRYGDLSSALEKMFSCFIVGQCGSKGDRGFRGPPGGIRSPKLSLDSDYVLTYEDKDGDWMLVGDVPWEMFTSMCTRLRIMKASDAIGLGFPQIP